MSIYGVVYLILAIILLVYVLKGTLDILAVGAVCYIVYTIYCIQGIGISGFYRPNLSPILYYNVYAQLLIILAFMAIVRNKNKRISVNTTIVNNKTANNQNSSVYKKQTEYAFYFYTAVIVVFALINIATIGVSGFLSGKASVWEQSNIFYVISLFGAFPSFSYGLHNKKKLIWIPSLLVELTIFIAGSRAFTATLIVMLLVEKGTDLWKNRKNNMRIYILGAAAVVFLLLYRMVDTQIMNGDFSGALQTLSNPATWLTALEFNEPRVIIANYDYVLTTNFRLPIGDVIYRFVDIVPFISSYLPINLRYPEYFSTWLQQAVHGSTGVGGTIWGESYAMFGEPGIIAFTILWLFVLNACNKHKLHPKAHSPFVLSLGIYYAWYINRLDFNRVAQVFKVTFMCFMIWGIAYLLMGGVIEFTKCRIYIKGQGFVKRCQLEDN